jgi:hypothetical protein
MKSMPDARENRRLADIQNGEAEKLPAGKKRNAYLKKADDLEASAHASDWREADLYPPK